MTAPVKIRREVQPCCPGCEVVSYLFDAPVPGSTATFEFQDISDADAAVAAFCGPSATWIIAEDES